jgi:glucoamylase
MPEHGLYRGKPAGSATPLVWAHAEYLKLLRSALDGKVFDRIDPVYERYCTNNRHGAARRGVEIYSLRRPVQRVNRGDTLRILDGERFELLWSTDGWNTTDTAQSRGLGSSGFSADLNTGPDLGQLSLTLCWPESGRWLGYNVNVEIVSR